MNNFESWEDNSDFPYVNKSRYIAYNKILKNSYLKTVDNWDNKGKSRDQQLNAMQEQLKIHNTELNEFKTGTNIHQGNNEWKETERSIIKEATIVCCTLSMAGSMKLESFRDRFEYLIVDEACQSTEPSTLIPFQHNPKRVILVGDQKQLPATTFSGNSE
jgi:senataxin